jgi:hypothetical protein
MIKRYLLIFIFLNYLVIQIYAQNDTSYIEIQSKMWFISEVDHSVIEMDEEGNQFDHYDNFIVVDYQKHKLKIPYDSNYIFWDKYDENMNVKKKVYRIVLQKIESKNHKAKHKLYKVFDKNKLIYDATLENPFIK